MNQLSSFREFVVTMEQKGVCSDDESMQNIRMKIWLDPNKKQASYTSAIGLFRHNAQKQYYLASEEWDEKKIDPDRERNECTFSINYRYPKDMDLKSIEKDLRMTHGIEKVKTDLYRVTDKWVENTIQSLQLTEPTEEEIEEIIKRQSASIVEEMEERKRRRHQENQEQITKKFDNKSGGKYYASKKRQLSGNKNSNKKSGFKSKPKQNS